MRRIRDNRENESIENAIKAYDNYSDQKHQRDYVKAFDADLLHNLEEIVRQIADESWEPKGYVRKVIFDRKKRTLAKAPIEDHVLESATILPYEKAIYDYCVMNCTVGRRKIWRIMSLLMLTTTFR